MSAVPRQHKGEKHPQAPPFENAMEIQAFLERPLLARFANEDDPFTPHRSISYQGGEWFERRWSTKSRTCGGISTSPC